MIYFLIRNLKTQKKKPYAVFTTAVSYLLCWIIIRLIFAANKIARFLSYREVSSLFTRFLIYGHVGTAPTRCFMLCSKQMFETVKKEISQMEMLPFVIMSLNSNETHFCNEFLSVYFPSSFSDFNVNKTSS